MRIERKLTDETKKKISEALRGRKKSQTHREALSKALKNYWDSIPFENNNIKINENENYKK